MADEFEKIFQKITSIIFGQSLVGYQDYETWLAKNVAIIESAKSKISSNVVYLPVYQFYDHIKLRVVTIDEGYEIIGKKKISNDRLESLSLSNAVNNLQDISITTIDTQFGVNTNLVETLLYYNSHSCFKSAALNHAKYCLYSFWPRKSEYLLGCYYTFSSQFCIKCYNSENLTRCFEVSDSNNCSDSLFCHNCENVRDSMFCFNAKNLKNAIGNVELKQEKYKAIKSVIVNQIYNELKQKKSINYNIFNIGRE